MTDLTLMSPTSAYFNFNPFKVRSCSHFAAFDKLQLKKVAQCFAEEYFQVGISEPVNQTKFACWTWVPTDMDKRGSLISGISFDLTELFAVNMEVTNVRTFI